LNKRLLNILIPANHSDKKRLLIDLLLVTVVFGGYFWYTHWTPAHKLESEHYRALSNVSMEDTRDALNRAETLYRTYTTFWDVKAVSADNKLQLKIYSSRKEFKRANPMSGWAEAFMACIKTPSGLDAFEASIGPYQSIEQQWYRHLLKLTSR
jgi:hypothetical protein